MREGWALWDWHGYFRLWCSGSRNSGEKYPVLVDKVKDFLQNPYSLIEKAAYRPNPQSTSRDHETEA